MRKLVLFSLAAILGVGCVSFLVSCYHLLSQPYQYVNGEPYFQYLSNNLAHGHQLYSAVTSTSYAPTVYPPVYFLIGAFLTKIFGSSLLLIKMISFLAGVGSCLLVGAIVRQVTKKWVYGALGGLLFSCTLVLKFMAPIVRTDTLGLMFSLLGIFLFIRYEGTKRVYWSIPALVLAFFTKQLFLSSSIAILIYLLFSNRRIFFKYASLLAGSVVLVMGIGSLLTGGQMFIQTIVWSYYQGSIDFSLLGGGIRTFLQYHFPIILGAMVYIGWRLNRKSSLGLLSTYFLVSFLVFLLTVGKLGASYHYGLETAAAGCILSVLLIPNSLRVLEAVREKVSIRLVYGALPILLLVAIPLGFPNGYGLETFSYRPGTDVAYAEVISIIKDTNKPVFTEEPIFPMRAGVQWDPWEPGAILISRMPSHGWDQSVIVSRLSNGYYQFVLVSFNVEKAMVAVPGTWDYLIYPTRLTKDMANAIVDHYTLVYSSIQLDGLPDGINVYRYV